MKSLYIILATAIISAMGCATYYTVPLSFYVGTMDVGTAALPYYAYSRTTLEAINEEFESSGSAVTLEDTYRVAYGKPFVNIPPDGDTGNTFIDMMTATRYLQEILADKGVADADRYFLTSIDTAVDNGFTLITAVYRPVEKVAVFEKYGAANQLTLTCDKKTYFRPYRIDCTGEPLDVVYDWAALPNDCFEKQGHQALMLTFTANKILERQPRNDYWEAEKQWIAGDYESVVTRQDTMVCQQLGIVEGYDKTAAQARSI